MLYIILFLLFISFYNSDIGKFLRFILTLYLIKTLFTNIFIDFSLSFWLFLFIILLNIPIAFKLSFIIIKNLYHFYNIYKKYSKECSILY